MRSKILTIVSLILFSSAEIFACRISLTSVKEKSTYRNGEFVEVVVCIEKTHGNCTNSIENTGFKTKNLKILNKTPWFHDETGMYYSKIKLKILGKKGDKCEFIVQRDCSRGSRNAVKYFTVK